jgi:hypothetical protein
MKIEIIGFYPNKNKNPKILSGTMHIYLIDHDIDVRGIFVIKNGKKWQFRLPYVPGYDEEEKKPVRYPTFSFCDPAKNKEMIRYLRDNGPEFILKQMAEAKKK